MSRGAPIRIQGPPTTEGTIMDRSVRGRRAFAFPTLDVPPAEGTAFVELSRRKGDFAMASAAARMRLNEDGTCASAHLMIGAVAPVPMRFDAVTDALKGQRISESVLREAVSLIDLELFEFDNPEISLAYRRHIGPVLARRALLQAFERAKGVRA